MNRQMHDGWMDGWMDGKMDGTQAEAERRDDNRYHGAEILYCFTNLNDFKSFVSFMFSQHLAQFFEYLKCPEFTG